MAGLAASALFSAFLCGPFLSSGSAFAQSSMPAGQKMDAPVPAQDRGMEPESQDPARADKTWREEKCARYGQAWREALTRFGRVGLSDRFLSAHEAFLERGCENPREVCPRSKEELALANILVLRSMNFGAAGTFAPFACAPSERPSR
jgi:hypothetical protein